MLFVYNLRSLRHWCREFFFCPANISVRSDFLAKRKKVTQKEVCDGLRRLAFGDIRDAVTLLYESEENIINILPELDLFNISEIKRPKGGGMEIKFFDRLKAIEKLNEMAQESDITSPVSFYTALERSAEALKKSDTEDCDE